ncbi:MAG: pyroglutamyl-peptidase I [Burkholderiales bacterium]|nr:pyroglutamyl-peptidase I [Burkholderiales bacterium]MDE1928006.1 pyroglutamyl-peptidase I [Burkholderiales bacterium]MDE2504270.1 pyroglutamyl-peptidase I [Burkholderiales bacterium]
MERILVSGFEPFGGDRVNPSWLVAQALQGRSIGGARVVAMRLPCVFGAAVEAIDAAQRLYRPRIVLALGLAAGRAELCCERVAINVDDARIADNAGRRRIDEPVVAGGPAAYFSTLPIKAMVAAMADAGLPAAVSQTAGTFVCNHVFYALMHGLRRRRAVRGGFMHVPLLPAQAAGRPALALERQIEGVALALRAAQDHVRDLQQTGGAIA